MIGYSILMFLTALIFAVIAVLIYKGNTKLIHDYHQAKVTDKTGYAKAFGKALGTIATFTALSGLLGLFNNCAFAAVAVLIIGLMIGVICIVRVQKFYNHCIF